MTSDALHRRMAPPGTICAIAGVAALTALWFGPLIPLSRTSFSAHMLLHLGVILIAAPLLAVPLAARLRDPGTFGEALKWYLLAATFEMLAVWGWHIPVLHDAVGTNIAALAAEQLSFLLGGMALWVSFFTARSHEAVIAAAIVATLTFIHMTMFGLLLALAPRLLYDPSLCQGFLGIDRLDDQHLGGAAMAGGGLAYLAASVLLGGRAIGRTRQRFVG